MTRKRFVKLMMSRGWSRNESNALAERTRDNGKSYETGYQEKYTVYYDANALVGKLQVLFDSVPEFLEAANRVAKVICCDLNAEVPVQDGLPQVRRVRIRVGDALSGKG